MSDKIRIGKKARIKCWRELSTESFKIPNIGWWNRNKSFFDKYGGKVGILRSFNFGCMHSDFQPRKCVIEITDNNKTLELHISELERVNYVPEKFFEIE